MFAVIPFDIEKVPDAAFPASATWWVEVDGDRVTVFVSETGAADPEVVVAYTRACRQLGAVPSVPGGGVSIPPQVAKAT